MGVFSAARHSGSHSVAHDRGRLPVEQGSDGERGIAMETLAPQTAHERDRRLPIGPRPSPGAKERDREVQRRGKPRRDQPENAGFVEAQGPAVEQVVLRAGAVYGAHERERLRVRAEQDVLPVIDGGAVGLDATRASAEAARGFEYRDRKPRGGKCHGGGEASVATADDRDPAADHGCRDTSNSTMSSMRSRLCAAASASSGDRARESRRARFRRGARGRWRP